MTEHLATATTGNRPIIVARDLQKIYRMGDQELRPWTACR